MNQDAIQLGAVMLGDGRCSFCVWTPRSERVEVHVVAPEERVAPLDSVGRGYHQAELKGVAPGSLYLYRLDGGKERPDPASRFQPEGVHKPSQVVDRAFSWADHHWFGLPLSDYILYELHVGTFTREGTFDAIIPRLDYLRNLGVTAVELMPVVQFPGGRNWGYDGVHPFAVQNSYGGPAGLKRLVNACHSAGLAVVLDVVYNHLGPEGNYLADFGPYFTDAYRTPWGPALNFDGPDSDNVRRFFIENAVYWLTDFHIDGLRLDAIHAIKDFSAWPFLAELAAAADRQAERMNRRFYLIAESNLNDTRLLLPRELGGAGLDAQWNDDFHHSLYTLVTGERLGYYEDFGRLEHLAKAFRESFVYTGQYSSYRRRRHGRSTRLTHAGQYVVCCQNHDQIGNRMLGDRLSQLVDFETLKLVAGVVLLSPFIPLLFMGEEYGETAPFPYFVSHSDSALVEAVRRGRKEEFASFRWQGEVPDPQDEATFLAAKLRFELRTQGEHRILLDFYTELIALRKELAALAELSQDALELVSFEKEETLALRRARGDDQVFAVFNFSYAAARVEVRLPAGRWQKRLDSAESRWNGQGSDAPQVLDSSGEVQVEISSRAVCLFVKVREA